MPTDTYISPILFTNTSYVCWEAWDTVGNNATGSRRILLTNIGDSDADGIPDAEDLCPDTPYYEVEEIVTDSGSPNYGCSPSEIDSDSDGMPDFWELLYGLNPNDPSDRDLDLDNDGLTNFDEYLQHSDPTIPDFGDSDNDGVTDDSDECPGTPPGETTNSAGCSPSQLDSDQDGIDDAWELRYGLDPNDPLDANLDLDKDKLTNYEEYTYNTNPNKKDTDGDGFDDKLEIDNGYNPKDPFDYPPKAKLFPLIILVLGILFVAGGAAIFILEKVKKPKSIFAKPQVQVRRAVASQQRPQAKLQPRPQQKPKISPIEERKKKILEKIRKERETKTKQRRGVFESFEERPKIKTTSIEREFTKPEYKQLPEKITIPQKKIEFNKLTNLTEQHLTKRTSPEPILKLTGVSKTHFDKLKKLIKERAGIKKTPEELTHSQKKEIKKIFSKLRKLKK